MQRVARHLAKTEMDADEVVDWVYGELYGTRVVDGERVSKFSTYGGRGSMRGWLRTVIWHSIVDMHRTGHDEVSLDEMAETIGEGAAHANFVSQSADGEVAMIDQMTRRTLPRGDRNCDSEFFRLARWPRTPACFRTITSTILNSARSPDWPKMKRRRYAAGFSEGLRHERKTRVPVSTNLP